MSTSKTITHVLSPLPFLSFRDASNTRQETGISPGGEGGKKEKNSPITPKERLPLSLPIRNPKPWRAIRPLVKCLLRRAGKRFLDLLGGGRAEDRLALLGREDDSPLPAWRSPRRLLPPREVGEGLGHDVDLGQVRVGRVPELAVEVLEEGVVGLAGVGFLDVVETAEGLCVVLIWFV